MLPSAWRRKALRLPWGEEGGGGKPWWSPAYTLLFFVIIIIIIIIITLHASCGIVYCNRSCWWVGVFVGGSVITITQDCVHRSSPNWVCSWRSSWLNFGRPAPPRRGSVVGRQFLAPPYYSQRAVFASPLSAFFITLKLCSRTLTVTIVTKWE